MRDTLGEAGLILGGATLCMAVPRATCGRLEKLHTAFEPLTNRTDMKNSKRRKIASKTAKIRIIDSSQKGAFEISDVDATVDGNLAGRMFRDARKAREAFDGKGEFAVYGNRLGHMRDFRLFSLPFGSSGMTYKNFKNYCASAEGISVSTASRLINSAKKVVALHDAGVVPPRTLAQIEPLLPLSDEDAVKVLSSARTKVGNDQPTSLLLREIAKDLGLRKPRAKKAAQCSNPLATLIEDLERAVALPKHADLRELVGRLKRILRSGKVADAATSTPDRGPSSAEQPEIGTGGDARSPEVPAVDRAAVTDIKPAALAQVIRMDSFNDPNGPDYVINIVGCEVHVRFKSGLACQSLKSLVPNWALDFRCGPDFNWVCKSDSAGSAKEKRDSVVGYFSKVGKVTGLSMKSQAGNLTGSK